MKKLASLVLIVCLVMNLAGWTFAETAVQDETVYEEQSAEAAEADAAEPDADAAEPGAAELDSAEPEASEAPDAEPAEEEGAEEDVEATVDAPAAEPEIGEVIHGFEVIDKGEFPLVNARVILFKHQKTGAQLLYLANDDTNRVFELSFRTPAENDKGTPHVFEHATLSGSEKYPSSDLFFNLSYQTYNTFMNAMTYNFMTTYPVASLSEAQLLKYADFYTDSCLHPMIMEDESIFETEAWRYEMADPEADLTIAGTVYSEMLGSYDANSAAYYNFMKSAFPGSTKANVSGGKSSDIPDLTWDDLKDYHDRYYHPSNALACLYGSFEDYEAFLELLDGYFSEYEAEEIVIEDSLYVPIEKAVTAEFAWPVESGSDTENASTVYYGIICPESDADVLDLLTTLLADDSSLLMERLYTALPYGSFSCYVDNTTPENIVIFTAENVNASDAASFKIVVDSALSEIAEQGFEAATVDALMAQVLLGTRLVTESESIGVNLLPEISLYWILTDDPYSYKTTCDNQLLFEEWNEQGRFTDAIKEYLLGNERNVLVTTVPVAGLKDAENAQATAAMAKVKAGLTANEVDAIVRRTNGEAKEGADEADTALMVKALTAVTVDTLPEEIREYEVTDETGDDHVRRLSVPANVDGIGQATLLIDTQHIALEDLHWLKLYTDLIGQVDTATHTRAELSALIGRYLYGFNFYPTGSIQEEGAVHPYLRLEWITTDEDCPDAYNLIYELLYETAFDNTDSVADQIDSTRSSLRQSIKDSPYSVQFYRAAAQSDPSFEYYNYMSLLDYYAFLSEAREMINADPETVAEALKRVQEQVRNSYGAISAYVGNEEGIALHREAADAFLARLDHVETAKAEYDLPEIASSEAIVLDSNVAYNLEYADYATLGLEEYTGDLDAITALVSDAYLYPVLRDQYGAYGVIHYPTDTGLLMCSYRDPHIDETFETYAQIPDVIGMLAEQLDQEQLDGYILSSYSGYALSTGELSGGIAWIWNILTGKDPLRSLKSMRALKAVKAEDLAGYADMYRALNESGVYSTSAGASAISSSNTEYDAILEPFGTSGEDAGTPTEDVSEDSGDSGEAADVTADAPSVSFKDLTDVSEDSEAYEAVKFMFDNGYMQPVASDRFGVDDDATVGDLLVALYAITFIEHAEPQAAADKLATYGILPEGIDVMAQLTRADAAKLLWNMSVTYGLKPAGSSRKFADASEVSDSVKEALNWAFDNEILAPVMTDDGRMLMPWRVLSRGELAQAFRSYYDMLVG